ncbi:MAG: hypothetical protein CL912_27305 [Deltaproteobacteria bacterium]|nr:hypothetical protein [Deltaproteobacteria bacterium]
MRSYRTVRIHLKKTPFVDGYEISRLNIVAKDEIFEPGLMPWSFSNVMKYVWIVDLKVDDLSIHYPGYKIV